MTQPWLVCPCTAPIMLTWVSRPLNVPDTLVFLSQHLLLCWNVLSQRSIWLASHSGLDCFILEFFPNCSIEKRLLSACCLLSFFSRAFATDFFISCPPWPTQCPAQRQTSRHAWMLSSTWLAEKKSAASSGLCCLTLEAVKMSGGLLVL